MKPMMRRTLLCLVCLALLLCPLATFAAAGAPSASGDSSNDDPFTGLWQITGQMTDGVYTSSQEEGITIYLDFLPSGAIYAVMSNGEKTETAYLAYRVTGKNTLDLYEESEAVSGVYDPATGVITITVDDVVTEMERVREDPLPDIRALVDDGDRERIYYGYRMSKGGQTMNMLEVVPALGEDVHDYALTLRPDGTGFMQIGEDASGEITWTETELTHSGVSVPCSWEGDHILVTAGDGSCIEFAPEGEVEALLYLYAPAAEAAAVDGDAPDLTGTWVLTGGKAMGVTISAEQVGTSMSLVLKKDGSAILYYNGDASDLEWALLDDSKVSLRIAGAELYSMTYDGTVLSLLEPNSQAELIFERLAGWVKTQDGKWTFYDAGGTLLTGWHSITDHWYYLDPNDGGARVTNWQEIGNKWYYFDSEGVMQTGWQSIGGRKYYLSNSGAMQTGWLELEGKRYYFNSSGALQTGWQTLAGKKYYLDSDGVMQTGWLKLGGKWYYLGTDGALLTGWQKISDKWYYLDADGVMQTGWLRLKEKWYYLGTDGVMVTKWKKIDNKWYYFESDGVMLQSTTKTIDGKSYTFDAKGVCTNP